MVINNIFHLVVVLMLYLYTAVYAVAYKSYKSKLRLQFLVIGHVNHPKTTNRPYYTLHLAASEKYHTASCSSNPILRPK